MIEDWKLEALDNRYAVRPAGRCGWIDGKPWIYVTARSEAIRKALRD